MSCRKLLVASQGAALLALAFLEGCAATGTTAVATRSGSVETSAAGRQVAEEFEQRVKEYRSLLRKLDEAAPKLPKRATPEQIEESRRAHGALIRTARAGAKRGEFFTPEMEALVKRTLREILSGPDGKVIKASIMDENPGLPNLGVNERYPDEKPLSTMPPQVLAALPKLEEELEYRFVGQRLALIDPHANIVVDLTGDVLP